MISRLTDQSSTISPHVGLPQEAVDGGLEIGGALEQAALESTAGQLSEEPLCRIKPRGRGLPCVNQPWVLPRKDLLRDALERTLGMRDDVAATRLLRRGGTYPDLGWNLAAEVVVPGSGPLSDLAVDVPHDRGPTSPQSTIPQPTFSDGNDATTRATPWSARRFTRVKILHAERGDLDGSRITAGFPGHIAESPEPR